MKDSNLWATNFLSNFKEHIMDIPASEKKNVVKNWSEE